LATLANSIAMTLGPEPANAQRSPVTAIDIALEPDHTMVDHAQAANATLLKNFPQGFSLDATHHPHVSIFAGFVPTADQADARPTAPPAGVDRRGNSLHGKDCHGGGVLHHSG